MLPLLAKVPVLPCLLTRQLVSKERLPESRASLLDWISAQVRLLPELNGRQNLWHFKQG